MIKIGRRLGIVVGICLIGTIIINSIIVLETSEYVYHNIEDLPEKQVVIILGAYVRGDRLSMVLEDRVKAGSDIYMRHKVDKILLSGDHGNVAYDEVNSMRKYIIKEGKIAPEAIFLDHAGFDTYDSMYRAKEIFDIEKAIIVTQDFHIDRAVYIARRLGIDAVGYAVNEDKYKISLQIKWHLREYLSRVKAFIDVVTHSKPKFLGDKIPITGDGRLSWDEE